MILLKLLDIFHLILLFHPIIVILFFNYFKQYLPFILLISVIVPLHWVFYNNECILTNISKKLGAYQDSETNSEFSETNLQWLYKPIMKVLQFKWNSEGLNKMVHLHWFVNFIVIWYLQNYSK